MTASSQRVVVLDDDPTGVQTLAGVRVLLEWTEGILADAIQQHATIHLLTNSRALPPADAQRLVTGAANAVRDVAPDALVVLRGDSTLRGHLLEEYLAVAESLKPPSQPPLLLAPALPSAGRVTVGGIQLLEEDGTRLPVHQSEYADDGAFGYTTSRLIDWAAERSDGFFDPSLGIELGLESLRLSGPRAVADALERAASLRRPAVVAVDCETPQDVETVAAGYRLAVLLGNAAILRCGPAVAGALEGATAKELTPIPSADAVFLVAGSYVSQSVRQLDSVRVRYPDSICEIDAASLAHGTGTSFAKISKELETRLDNAGLAVLVTSSTRAPDLDGLAAGLRIANGLARIVAGVERPGALVVLKGGVTSAVALRVGLSGRQADVVGPVLPGVALWQVIEPTPRRALVVPGNVGDDQLLVRIIELSGVGA